MKKHLLFISLLMPLLIHGQEANISNGLVFDGEPYLIVNPHNQQNIVVAWMGFVIGQNITIKVKSSSDGGANWSAVKLMPHLSPTWHSADPSMAFDKNGNLFLCYIDYRQSPDSGGVYVIKSTDGGLNWGAPLKAFDLFDNGDKPLDRPWLAIDRSSSAHSGNMYITTKPAPWDVLPNHPYYKFSSDGGSNWSNILSVDSADFPSTLIPAPMAYPAVSASGKLQIAYPSWKGGLNPARFVLAESVDGGATLTRKEFLNVTQGNGGDTISKLGYTLMANPADANNLVFTGPIKTNGEYDVQSMYSLNGGTSWSALQRVNDDSIGNNRDQEMVWQAFDTGGNLVIAWRDRRNASGSGYAQDYDIYAAVSKNKGQSFGKNFRLNQNTAPYNALLEQNGNDFLGLGLAGDTAYCAWGDMRSGKLNIFFNKVTVTTGSSTFVKLAEEPLVISLFPNPVITDLKIGQAVASKANKFSILDASGKLIHAGKLQQNRIAVSHLPAGMYWLQLEGDNLKTVSRFVKN